MAERRFAEPIDREEDIAATLTSLAATLAQSLETHGEGARRLEFSLFRVDGVVTRIAVGAGRPIRAPKLILALFREKFTALGDEVDAGFGFDMARLSVTASAAADPVQIDLTGEARRAPTSTASSTASAHASARKASTASSPMKATSPSAPSISCRPAKPMRSPAPLAGMAPDAGGMLTRPLRLFARPELVEVMAEVPDSPPLHFRWRRVLYRVARAEGPERIAAEWWRNDGPHPRLLPASRIPPATASGSSARASTAAR